MKKRLLENYGILALFLAVINPVMAQTAPSNDLPSFKPVQEITSDKPRLGKYTLLSDRANIGIVVLGKDSSYKYYATNGKYIGGGYYSYDAVNRKVIWKNGPFMKNGWNGNFEASQDGKMHILRLTHSLVASSTIN